MKTLQSLTPLILAITLLLGGCAGTPEAPPPIDPSSAEVLAFIEENRLTDGRGRFREIFCVVLEEHGQALPDYRSCEDALTYVGEEKGATGEPVALGPTGRNYLFLLVPGSKCEEEHGDNDAVASLRTEVRRQWLAEHPLPAHIRYYSVVTFPDPDRISSALRNAYRLLGQHEARNDTQVIIFDQIIPGSMTAFLNADHWAIAVPVSWKHPLLGKTLVNHNDYPREAFLEALLRFLDEDLDR